MKASTLLLSAGSLLFAAQGFAASINPFSLPWVNGPARDSIYRTADHPTGIFILEAFQNFCPHCHNNAPAVDAMYKHYVGQDRVQVIDLDLDTDPGEVQAWLDKYHPAYPVIQDANGDVFGQFGGDNGIPQTVVLDCKGQIAYHTEGEWDEQATRDMQKTVDGLLAQTCTNS